MSQLVWTTRIFTKNFVSDFLENVRNILGGRLKRYESMIDECIEETWEEFHEKYPTAHNIRVDSEHFTTGAYMVTITGEVEEK